MGHDGLIGAPAAHLLARFAYEHGIGRVREVAAFLDLSREEFTRLRRSEGWQKRRIAAPAWRLGPFLASYDAPSDADGESAPQACFDTADIAAALHGFIAHRLHALSEAGSRSNPRELVDLTRCLKELVALEERIARRAREDRAGREGEGGDDAILAGGTASDLAEIVALEVERLHERHGTGGALDALYPADAADSGGELGARRP